MFSRDQRLLKSLSSSPTKKLVAYWWEIKQLNFEASGVGTLASTCLMSSECWLRWHTVTHQGIQNPKNFQFPFYTRYTQQHFNSGCCNVSTYCFVSLQVFECVIQILQDPISPISYKQRTVSPPSSTPTGNGTAEQQTNGYAANGTEERWRQNYVPTPYESYKVECIIKYH